MSDFTQLVDLAGERLGGRVVLANDEFFAPKENLLKAAKPVYIEGKYTEFGKWMDGWETRRRRTPGYDWCIVQLGAPGILRGVVVDTSFFKGNFPEYCSIEACGLDGSPDVSQLASMDEIWTEVLPKSKLEGDTQNRFSISDPHRYTHLRFKIYPDGGIARLRVHGEAVPDWKQVLAAGKQPDLIAVHHGGRIVSSSDMFFSSPQNLILPGPALNMGEGWETRRRRGPGHDWVIIRLGIRGVIQNLELSTAFFKGNFPESCSLEACDTENDEALASCKWIEVLPRTSLKPDAAHRFPVVSSRPATHIRLNIFPDGGVSRLRVYGVPEAEAIAQQNLRLLNAQPDAQAKAALLSCCGSAAWVAEMLLSRPFASPSELRETANRVWSGLGKQEWLAAFQHHPRIGEKRAAAAAQPDQAQRWSEQEQSAVTDAPAQALAQLAAANDAYVERFGYIFIVCASGKSGDEMLALLRRRLQNDPETELRIAAEEQRKITQLRLAKLLGI
ncbi:MAG TPA: allantoicase [Terracidiphilus sp.]|nr:allantoicase [Terracidiphilus sp.]